MRLLRQSRERRGLIDHTVDQLDWILNFMFARLTEQVIIEKLEVSIKAAGDNTDGYAEIESDGNLSIKCAAVLVPLVRLYDEWHLLFTRRTDRVESHKGQVSFPGGACDEGDQTPEDTALRESQEELGIQPKDVRILGRLTNLLTISSYRVTPVVGVIPWPYVFHVQNVEVARVFTIPIDWLAEGSHKWHFGIPGTQRQVICYHPYDGELLWGATARITVDLLETLGLLNSPTG